MEFFGLLIDGFVKDSIATTWAFPELNGIVGIGVEKSPKFLQCSSYMDLKEIQ